MLDLRRRNRKIAFSAAFHSGKFHEMKFFFFHALQSVQRHDRRSSLGERDPVVTSEQKEKAWPRFAQPGICIMRMGVSRGLGFVEQVLVGFHDSLNILHEETVNDTLILVMADHHGTGEPCHFQEER